MPKMKAKRHYTRRKVTVRPINPDLHALLLERYRIGNVMDNIGGALSRVDALIDSQIDTAADAD